MCLCYELKSSVQKVAARFDCVQLELPLDFPVIVRPTNVVPIVRMHAGHRNVMPMRWGLVPPWAKDISVGKRYFNVRSETAHALSVFRSATEKRRCIIPVTAFCEWKAIPGQKRKEPMWFGIPDAELYAIAGIWETWQSPENDTITSFSLLTTEPNSLVERVHDRMPVIVRPGLEDAWLGDPFSEALLQAVREPFPAKQMFSNDLAA